MTKVTFPIRNHRVYPELVFSYVKRPLDLRSNGFQVRNLSIFKKSNYTTFGSGLSLILLENVLTLLDTFPDL